MHSKTFNIRSLSKRFIPQFRFLQYRLATSGFGILTYSVLGPIPTFPLAVPVKVPIPIPIVAAVAGVAAAAAAVAAVR